MAITIHDLTEANVDGNGVFDVMMQSIKGHLVDEYKMGRIKGPEYATVYLGALQSTQDRALDFLLQRDKLALELQLLQVEIEKLIIEKEKAAAEVLLVQAQVKKVDADVLLANAQTAKAVAELALIILQEDKIAAETALLVCEKNKCEKESLFIVSKTTLTDRQADNEIKQGLVLDATVCKLQAEFDVLQEQKLKVSAETGLLGQKKVTEQAQTNGAGVDGNSVIGKQMSLYAAQAAGFQRDAEQKATKIMVDSWNVRRTTDEGTPADGAGLGDGAIASAVSKLLSGI